MTESIVYDRLVYQLSQEPADRSPEELAKLVAWFKAKSEVIAKCDRDVVIDLLQNCSIERYLTDDLIIKSGERGDCFYIILNGCVSVWIDDSKEFIPNTDSSGRRNILSRTNLGIQVAVLGIGQGFGELALINKDCTRTATIICDDPCILLTVNRVLYNRSIKSWQAREFYEKYNFIHNSIFFSMLPPRNRNQLASALTKCTFKFGNNIIKQGDRSSGLIFVLSGQVRISCQPLRLMKALQKYKLMSDQPIDIAADTGSENSIKDICFLSSYDVIGALEMTMDLPVAAYTATVEEEVKGFHLSKQAYQTIIKEKSPKTVAALLNVSIMQTEARLKRYPATYNDFKELLLGLLVATYRDVCKKDQQLMKYVDDMLYNYTTQASGFGKTPLGHNNSKTDDHDSVTDTKPARRPFEEFQEEGEDFLSSLTKLGGNNLSIAEAKRTAKRYAMTAGLKSSNKGFQEYIKALLTSNDIITRVNAWNGPEDSVMHSPVHKTVPVAKQSSKRSPSPMMKSLHENSLSIVSPRGPPKLASLMRAVTVKPSESTSELKVLGSTLTVKNDSNL